jgi:nucleotide-binding universal stress UspA family protein
MIVIGYDGSENARAALTQAATLMPGYPAVVLTVWEAAEPRPGEAAPAGQDQTWAEEVAAEGIELAHQVGIDCTSRTRHRTGTVAGAILEEADEIGASAIVVGRAETPLEPAGLGAVVSTLLRESPCAVLVARPAGHGDHLDGQRRRSLSHTM